MKKVNLREFYPSLYTKDTYVFLPDDVVTALWEETKREDVYKRQVRIRIPLIPKYNTEHDQENSAYILQKMGFSNLEFFRYVIKQPGRLNAE